MKKKLDITHPQLIKTLNRLCKAYKNIGYDNSPVNYWPPEVKLMYEHKFGKKHTDIILILMNLGSTYCDLENHHKAIKYFEKARTLGEKRFGADYLPASTILGNLEAIYNKITDYNQAIKYLEEAIIIEEKAGGPAHLRTNPAVITSLGNTYYYLGDYNKTIKYYKQALAILGKLPRDLPITNLLLTLKPELLYMLGRVYNALGNYTEQIIYQEKTLIIKEQALGKTDVNIAVILNSISLAYGNLNKYEEQIKYHERALEIERVVGQDDNNSRKTLQNLLHTCLNFAQQNHEQNNLSLSIAYQEKTNNLLSHRSIKHNLSCYYHISARQALQNNDHTTYVNAGVNESH